MKLKGKNESLAKMSPGLTTDDEVEVSYPYEAN